MSTYAQDERQGLADDLARLGPKVGTLCEGWSSADLAAHLVIRDRRPDAAIGMLGGPLAARTERILEAERDGRTWAQLVDRVRSGPPFPLRLRPLDEAINTVEYFVHHEDLLRAQTAALPRELDASLQAALWTRIGLVGRMALRRSPVGVVVVAPGHGTKTVKRSTPEVTVTGLPSDLMLWAFGRRGAADVSYQGDEVSVERLKQSKPGL